MKLVFRTVNSADARDVEQFNVLMDHLSRRADNRELLVERIAEANRNPDKYLMVAEDAETGTLCGSILAVLIGDFCGNCAPIMLVENVVTHKGYQRRGIGRQMFDHIEAWGRDHGVSYIILCSAMHRKEAHQFYEAIDYNEVKGFKKYL